MIEKPGKDHTIPTGAATCSSTIQRLLSTQSLQKVNHWAHNLYENDCWNAMS